MVSERRDGEWMRITGTYRSCGDTNIGKERFMAKRIGIIGSRRRATNKDFAIVRDMFRVVYEDGDWIVSGGCYKGGDNFAERIAKIFEVPILILYAPWKKDGKSAGFNRNTTIAENSDILIACCSIDRSGGTEDTIRKFKRMGHPDVDVILV